MQTKKTIAVVDYGSFSKKYSYYGSINELMDTLIGKQLEVYALLPIDKKEELPSLDISIRGVIPYSLTDNNEMLNIKTKQITNCYDEKRFLIISSNSTILSSYERDGFTTFMINTEYNDVTMINNIKKIGQLIK